MLRKKYFIFVLSLNPNLIIIINLTSEGVSAVGKLLYNLKQRYLNKLSYPGSMNDEIIWNIPLSTGIYFI
jgi:hypothetical protein